MDSKKDGSRQGIAIAEIHDALDPFLDAIGEPLGIQDRLEGLLRHFSFTPVEKPPDIGKPWPRVIVAVRSK